MAKWVNFDHADDVLETFNIFSKRCFLSDRGLFQDKNLWTKYNIDTLKSLFLDNPILDKDKDFYQKLEIQIKDADSDVQKLAAEVMWLVLLFVYKNSFQPKTKIDRIKQIWSWSGEEFPMTQILKEESLKGLANPGVSFLTRIWEEYGYVLKFLSAWKNLPSIERNRLINDNPWEFGSWCTKIEGGNIRAFRHMLLYLSYPDSYERICSLNHKVTIFKAFSDRLEKPISVPKNFSSVELDKALFEIRKSFEKEYKTSELDFYVDPLKDQWESDYERKKRIKEGDDWDEEEIQEIVNNYFKMLKKEINGESYNKTAYRKNLMSIIDRTKGSIEFKHQNISAVLHELGFSYIKGYKPYHNYQNKLAEAVSEYLDQEKYFIYKKEEESNHQIKKVSLDSVFIEMPKPKKSNKPKEIAKVRRLSKYNPAERDSRNRKLGLAAEEFVLEVEKQRLISLGREDLSKKIEWTSQDKGDGAGYDIQSFNERGEDIFIEVKGTKGPALTPFYISANEVAVSEEKGDSFYIYRVHNLHTEPKIYKIQPPLSNLVLLTPINYRVELKEILTE